MEDDYGVFLTASREGERISGIMNTVTAQI